MSEPIPDYNKPSPSPYCTHQNLELRQKPMSNGVMMRRLQCLTCGETGGPVSRKSAPDDVLPEDENLRHEFWANFRQRQEKQRSQEREEWRAAHTEYCRSPQWRDLRLRVLRRANGLCEGCGDKPAEQVHHITYKHWRAEFLFELVALCRNCHERVHGHD